MMRFKREEKRRSDLFFLGGSHMSSESSYQSRRQFLNLSVLSVFSTVGHFKTALADKIPFGGDVGQQNWRGCNKCSGLFYDGAAPKGVCPAGGGHFAQGFNFTLPFNTAPKSDTQKDWRFCRKCSGMFYAGFSEPDSKSRCRT
jgi:hypothetical protein